MSTKKSGDPLLLEELFQGGGEPWLPLLKPTIEGLKNADQFIGSSRNKTIVPVRELTFQALKPNPPDKWKVVIFGQNPYPRVESATGIAMFDNTFNEWKDSRFGRVTSIRCIIKAGCMWKHGIIKKTPTSDIRALLAKDKTVQPPEWFQAMLTQGVLLLNAALTASSDGSMSTSRHATFWRPVVQQIIEEILKAKQATKDTKHKGVVFAWWGTHARALRKVVDKLVDKYPNVPIKHVDHCNPAAMGDAFCEGHHFADINQAIKSLHMGPVDWLPVEGWDAALAKDRDTADRMGDFIATTMELHKHYLERLQSVKDEKLEELAAISGVHDAPLMGFADATAPVAKLVKHLDRYVTRARAFATKHAGKAGKLTEHEIAALHLYTTESSFYRKLNAALRHPNRATVKPYLSYLRLFFSGLAKIHRYDKSLWRGVGLDLRAQYPKGATITWWGVSSCTSKESVARGFLRGSGRRMLFEVKPRSAVSIKRYSSFTGEDEYILAPGTQLQVTEVKHQSGGLSLVQLKELPESRLVS